jgi:hypothetical protein
MLRSGASRPASVTCGGVKPREAGAHILQFLAEVAGQVAQLPEVGAVFVRILQRAARDIHDVRPERAVRVHRLLVLAEVLRRDERGDLRAVHGGQMGPADSEQEHMGHSSTQRCDVSIVRHGILY